MGHTIWYVIQNLIELGEDQSNSMQDLNTFYKESKKRFDTDENFAKSARDRVVLLQSKDPETYALWKKIVEQSRYTLMKFIKAWGFINAR